MRNPERLYPFYIQMCEIHKNSFPDIRFGQMMWHFFYWLNSEKHLDPFYPEENEMLELFQEYANSIKRR